MSRCERRVGRAPGTSDIKVDPVKLVDQAKDGRLKAGGVDPKKSLHLRKTLEKIGGHFEPGQATSQLMHDPDADLILKRGVLTDLTKPGVHLGIPLWGKDGECHWNVGALYAKGQVDAIVIGYARNIYGWHQHTWGLKNGQIIETTPSNKNVTHYFGVTLSPEGSVAFAAWTQDHRPGMGAVRAKQ